MHLPQAHADSLRDYVAQGGAVIGFAKLGHVDERGWAWNDRPGAGLTTLFGAKETHIEVFREAHDRIILRVDYDSPLFAGIEANTIAGFWHRQEFELADDVEILARFVDGGPAVIRRRYGQGQAILVATHLDMAYWGNRDPALRRLFDNLMALCGVTKDVIVASDDAEYSHKRVDAHLLSHGDQHAVLVNNEGESAVDVTIRVPAAVRAAAATELFSGAALDLSQDDGALFSLHMPAEDGAIVMLV
jgi:hypothetical protein